MVNNNWKTMNTCTKSILVLSVFQILFCGLEQAQSLTGEIIVLLSCCNEILLDDCKYLNDSFTAYNFRSVFNPLND